MTSRWDWYIYVWLLVRVWDKSKYTVLSILVWTTIFLKRQNKKTNNKYIHVLSVPRIPHHAQRDRRGIPIPTPRYSGIGSPSSRTARVACQKPLKGAANILRQARGRRLARIESLPNLQRTKQSSFSDKRKEISIMFRCNSILLPCFMERPSFSIWGCHCFT